MEHDNGAMVCVRVSQAAPPKGRMTTKMNTAVVIFVAFGTFSTKRRGVQYRRRLTVS